MNTTSHKRLAFATKALLTIGMLVAIIVYADAEKMVASWKRADCWFCLTSFSKRSPGGLRLELSTRVFRWFKQPGWWLSAQLWAQRLQGV